MAELTDTGKALTAIADDVREAVQDIRKAAMSPQASESAEVENKILKHQTACWEHGPVSELRKDMSALKAWVKGVGIAITILQLLNAYSNFTGKFGKVPIPSAHAEVVKK